MKTADKHYVSTLEVFQRGCLLFLFVLIQQHKYNFTLQEPEIYFYVHQLKNMYLKEQMLMDGCFLI